MFNNLQSKCLLKIALLLFGKLAITEHNFPVNMSQDCSSLKENSTSTSCDCSSRALSYFIEYEFECAVIGTDSIISIKFEYDKPVSITCFGLDLLDYSLLPYLTESSSSTVQLLHCALPPKQPIHNIFLKLGLIYVNELEYDWGGTLERIHFEKLQNLSKLSINSNDTSNVPEDLFADLGNLIHLELSNIINLPLNLFSPLENLKSFNLKNTSLHDLPPEIFQNTNKLTHVHLEGNNLINLTKNAFEQVSSILELELISNGIVTFSPDVFLFLPHLDTLVLEGNQIVSLPDGLFANNKNLSSFHLFQNRVQLIQLPVRLLANLPKLKVVRISCGLKVIPEDLFFHSKDVWKITITENYFTDLPLKLFADQIKLQQLDLSQNQLMSLPDGIFQNNTMLNSLRLSQNHLVTITNNIFFASHSLKYLYLDNNDIFTIQSGPFLHTKYLGYIDLQNNKISGELSGLNVSISLQMFTQLDLSYNNISTIKNFDQKVVDGIVFVNVSHNSIQKVYFNNFEKIILDISNNPIDCGCELLSFVQFLKSKNATNYIDWVGESLDMFQCKRPKDLEGYKVSQLSPQELICPHDRESFSAKLCPENCSCWVRSVDGVAVVNCSNTNLVEMPILPNLTLPQLSLRHVHGTELHIENNRLTQLANANTPGYMHVVKLYASNNSLTDVLAINLPKNLSFLDLSQNKIQHLHDTTLSVLNGSRITVALHGNPWICDCTTQSLVRIVMRNNKIIRDVEQMECADGQKFQEVSLSIICSPNQRHAITAGVVIAVIGLCAGISAAFYYKYKQEIKVWLYVHGMCFWFVTEEDLDKDKQYDAFISYSHRDEDFIVDYLLPELENGPNPFKLCLHTRDWVIGEFISDQILRSVKDSRRTIIVLSPNFLESIWGRMEFRAAHNATLKEGRARVIVILYGDVGNIGSLDPELKAYLQMNTYVKWGDPWFWNKLRYAMPFPSKNEPGFENADPDTSTDNNIEFVEPRR